MSIVGTVDGLWRYPVKSMRGEELEQAFVGFPGVYGDRHFAFKSTASPKGFPYLTGREQERLLQYRPRFRHPERTAGPPNLAEAERLAPGINPVSPDPEDLSVQVETPSGTTLAIDDPELVRMLGEGISDDNHLTLVRSERALADCRPVSLISLQTVEQIGADLDPRRFRANIYMDSASGRGFDEDEFVGRSLRIGEKAVVAILERDPRCKMISLDPDTGEHDPNVLRKVANAYGNRAGVYCAVLVEGMVNRGDPIELMD